MCTERGFNTDPAIERRLGSFPADCPPAETQESRCA
jgi:hypothetical protein